MIIGAAKCGTTSLANHLAKHPEVCFSREKEPEYFSHQTDWQSKIRQYHQLYDPAPGQVLGEASTSYTMIPENENTHLRLFEYNPAMKLIYIMRDPVQRMISHFAHNYVRKRISQPLETEVLENQAYVTRSSYATQIKPYLDTFGNDQVLLLIFEEFINDQQTTMIKVAEFLGIDPGYYKKNDAYGHKNSSYNRKILPDGDGAGKFLKPLKRFRRFIPESIVRAGLGILGNSLSKNPEFPAHVKSELYRRVQPEIAGIEEIMGRQIGSWKVYNS